MRYRPILYVHVYILGYILKPFGGRRCGAAMGWALATHGPRGYFLCLGYAAANFGPAFDHRYLPYGTGLEADHVRPFTLYIIA